MCCFTSCLVSGLRNARNETKQVPLSKLKRDVKLWTSKTNRSVRCIFGSRFVQGVRMKHGKRFSKHTLGRYCWWNPRACGFAVLLPCHDTHEGISFLRSMDGKHFVKETTQDETNESGQFDRTGLHSSPGELAETRWKPTNPNVFTFLDYECKPLQ